MYIPPVELFFIVLTGHEIVKLFHQPSDWDQNMNAFQEINEH